MSFEHELSFPSPSALVRLEVAVRTHVGKVRLDNEDRAVVAHLGRGERSVGSSQCTADASRGGMILAVCDGMGGEAGGEVASSCAVDELFAALARSGPVVDSQTLGRRIVDALDDASARIQEIAAREPKLRGMGTTATVAGVVDERLVVAQVGDSRAYRLRAGRLEQLTRDQTLVAMMVEQGQLTPEQADSCGYGHVILQAVGSTKTLTPDLQSHDLVAGDTLLICSDGLTGIISHDALRAALLVSASCEEACERLIDIALAAGAPDNVTCIVARATGAGLAAPENAP
jgi:protein phosphatase